MAIALVTHTGAQLGPNGGTTSAIDTTGASLLVVAAGYYSLNPAPTLSDSKSNTWTALTTATFAAANLIVGMYYTSSPTVGSAHTFTLAGTGEYSSIAVASFSGSLAGGSADLNQGANATQPGSGTPGHNNELVVTAAGGGAAGSAATVDSGFTITDQEAFVGGTEYAVALAYLIQTTATAENPTWGGFASIACTMASFQATPGSFFFAT